MAAAVLLLLFVVAVCQTVALHVDSRSVEEGWPTGATELPQPEPAPDPNTPAKHPRQTGRQRASLPYQLGQTCSRWELYMFQVRMKHAPGESLTCSRWEFNMFQVRIKHAIVRIKYTPGENETCSRWELNMFQVRMKHVPGKNETCSRWEWKCSKWEWNMFQVIMKHVPGEN